MGGFYGSVQVKTHDRDAVRAAVEAVAAAQGIRCYLGPALDGWVGAYPQFNGQDASFGEEVASRLDAPVLHLMVHDDDIFSYEFWDGGQHVDSYWSRPGYFGEQERAAQELACGRPEMLAGSFGCDAEKLKQLLARESGVAFEFQRLDSFAKLLCIPNAVTAYEYLQAGERTGIRGWKEFEALPAAAIANEKQAKQERRRQITAERKALKKEGKLLAEKKFKGFGVKAYAAGDRGFCVLWNHYANLGGIEVWQPPWKPAARTAVEMPEVPYSTVASGDGSRIALSLREATLVVESGDWSQPVARLPAAPVVALSTAGDMLALADHKITQAIPAGVEVRVVRVGDGVVAARGTVGEATHGTFSPDGLWFVAAGNDLHFARIGGEGPFVRRLIGGRHDTSFSTALLTQLSGGEDCGEILMHMEAQIESTTEELVKMMGLDQQMLSGEEFEAMRGRLRQQMYEQLERMKGELEARKSGKLPEYAQWGKERPFSIGFAGDGEWFWCATDKGVRVYDWQAVVAAGDEMPAAAMQFEPPGDPERMPQTYIYSAVEAGDGALLFGGLTDVVYRMDLATGEVRELLVPPEGGAIRHLAMSLDGDSLGVVSSPGFPETHGDPAKQSHVWEVWSYSAIGGGA